MRTLYVTPSFIPSFSFNDTLSSINNYLSSLNVTEYLPSIDIAKYLPDFSNSLAANALDVITDYLPSSLTAKAATIGLVALGGMVYIFRGKLSSIFKREKIDMELPEFHRACRYNQLTKVKEMLASYSKEQKTRIINSAKFSDWTPIMYACSLGHWKVVKLLLEQEELNPNLINSNCGTNALMIAMQEGHLNIVKLLLQDKKVDVNAQDRHGNTPLMHACILPKNLELIKLLKTRPELDPNIRNKEGKSALTEAILSRHVKVVEALLKIDNIDPNQPSSNGLAPLFHAKYHEQTLRLLLSHPKINPNPINPLFQQIPLHFAAANYYYDITSLFLQKGALIDAKDKKGRTPLHLTVHSPQIMDLLLKAGANPHIKDNDGHTPYDLAINQNQHAAAEKLAPYKLHSDLQTVVVSEDAPSVQFNTYLKDPLTNDLYHIENSYALAAKSIIHFTLTPLHIACAAVNNTIFIAIDLCKVAFQSIHSFVDNLKKFDLYASFKSLGKSIVIDLPSTLVYSIWKVVRLPIFGVGMLFASLYGVIQPSHGRLLMNKIGSAWEEEALLYITGLQKVGNLTNSTTKNGIAKYTLKSV